ncbi:iron-containing alcohol dehydrogenase [Burkholderia multivorans]|uniref:iron-containing alcohol dehydrogenase n=1 Tax=Burkholderia multivorans TaxID=87883 RepID=UPI002019BD34|nr:iron-containing alcohol dehydrogenase [Burkholderia multivorans]MCO1374654.1 iron-containing alcohol dehydrogenase [Burkholderia multivorans]MCO1459796.1 iron-containing alcohol dehydrogenase [Burkholderia multivorans]MCO1463797.1 iron-containing alcohol dehydrogenase [Burkholderia multivorans]UQO21201.1 iron-containing alcohol dehydrogenase [Burkholderia multivorans]UQO87467.1 iron-containing alcohol dehydrogenase [Burkholderia multivorans]
MNAFSFETTPSIRSGSGISRDIAALIAPTLGQRILIVTDAGIRKVGLLGPIEDNLRAAGLEVSIYDEVAADPPESNILGAVVLAEQNGVTGVLGIGGGSPMDVAKVTALLAGNRSTLDEAYGVRVAKGPRLPLALIPTTAGTGSEVTPIAIITTGESEKKGIVSPLLLPDIAILDGELTLGLPAAVTAATGIDAIVHAIEAITSTSANNNPISKTLAVQALRLLGANIRIAVFDGRNAAARNAMLLGSCLAGQAFANSPVAAVHALAYPIGARYHVPHGLSNALVLPHVMRFNLSDANSLYAEIASELFPDLSRRPETERASSLIDQLQVLSRELGVAQRLRDVGISEDALATLASDAMKQTRLLVNNPRKVTESDALAIYQAAY